METMAFSESKNMIAMAATEELGAINVVYHAVVTMWLSQVPSRLLCLGPPVSSALSVLCICLQSDYLSTHIVLA